MEMIGKTGVYDIPAERYHSDPCEIPSLSSSLGKILLTETASHAYTAHPRLNPQREEEDDAKFDRGKACHILVLGDAERFKVVAGFDDWKTKEARAQRDRARADGLIPLLEHQMADVRTMHTAFVQQIAHHRDSADIFTGGKCEQTLVWEENVRGQRIMLRSLLDYMKPDSSIFGDYKSLATNVNPDNLHKYAFNAGWDFQDAFYRRGIQAVLGVEKPHFKFVVQEAAAPWSVVVVDFPPEAKDYADAKVDEAIDQWAWCMKNNQWPGYPAFTCTLEVPPWIGGDFEARKHRKAEGGVEMYAQGLKFQAPL